MTVETYSRTSNRGTHIRQATRVRFTSGGTISFDEKLSKRAALAQVERMRTGFPHERRLVIEAENGIKR